MKPYKVLYSSSEIHTAIKRLFSNPVKSDSRIALVAYVGTDCESYLPHPNGLRVICSPVPGGTDPNAIRNLISRGASVEFSDRLHMKVYWCRNRGCIITSANASSNALGVNGLREAGILLPKGAVNIRQLLKYAQPRPIGPKELKSMDRTPQPPRRPPNKSGEKQAMDFLKWYASPQRSTWKCGWADSNVTGTAKAVKEETLSAYGKREPCMWISVAKDRVRKYEWILSFTFTDNGVRDCHWLYVDFVVPLTRKEKRYYYAAWPCHAVQVNPLSRCPLPPFAITASFRKALKAALDKKMRQRIMTARTDIPPERMIKAIADNMKSR